LARRADPEKASPGTREKILEAAEWLIALHGIEGFQLTDVADAVGIRPPSVYAHFEGREAIAQEVAYRLYRGIQTELKTDRFERGDPSKELRRVIRKVARYYAQHPAHLRLTLRDLNQTAFPGGDGEAPSVRVWDEIAESWDRGRAVPAPATQRRTRADPGRDTRQPVLGRVGRAGISDPGDFVRARRARERGARGEAARRLGELARARGAADSVDLAPSPRRPVTSLHEVAPLRRPGRRATANAASRSSMPNGGRRARPSGAVANPN